MGRLADPYGENNRPPEGMVRSGYDGDTAQYYYRDQDGIAYQASPGAEYGVLMPVRSYSTREDNARYKRKTFPMTNPTLHNPPARRSMSNPTRDPRPTPIRAQTTPLKSILRPPKGTPRTKQISPPPLPPMPTRSRTLSSRSKDVRIPSPIPEMPTPAVTIDRKGSVISQASIYSQASARSQIGPAAEVRPAVAVPPPSNATSVADVTPIVEAEPNHKVYRRTSTRSQTSHIAEVRPAVEIQPVSNPTPAAKVVEEEPNHQVDSGPVWPPIGWRVYILALSIDPSSSKRPNLMEYLFDQDTLTFFHPSTICTTHLSESSHQVSKREGAAALIAECRRDSMSDELSSPHSPLPSEEPPKKSAVPFPSSLKGASLVNLPHIPPVPDIAPPLPVKRTRSLLKKKRPKPPQEKDRSSSSS